MRALILAAGLGTRLRPLTDKHAKPSLPVLGIPTLWFNAWHLNESLKVEAFAINASHALNTLKKAAQDKALQKYTGIQFHLSEEIPQILGSSGALWKLRPWIGNHLLCACNTDTICFPNWTQMVEFHQKKKAAMTLHLRPFESTGEPYTDISIDPEGRVLALNEKVKQGLMFSGAYILEPEIIKRIPEGVSELRPTLLEPLIAQKKLFAFKENIPWFDTGTLDSYIAVQKNLLKDLPQARKLIEVKMAEVIPQCWVPKTWLPISRLHGNGSLSLNAFCAITGKKQDWLKWNSQYGPNFVGIEAPDFKQDPVTQNALVFRQFIRPIGGAF